MYKKAGEAAGKVVGTVGAAVAGGVKASNNPGAGFGDFLKGAGDGAKNYKGLLGDKAKKAVNSGMSDITGRSKKSGDDGGIDYESIFAELAKAYST